MNNSSRRGSLSSSHDYNASGSSYNLSSSEKSGRNSSSSSSRRRISRRRRKSQCCPMILQKVAQCCSYTFGATYGENKQKNHRMHHHRHQLGVSILSKCMIAFVSVCAIVSFTFESLFLPKDESIWCKTFIDEADWQDYENPDYDANPCLDYRTHYLLFLTQKECDYIRRMLYSIIIGAAAGVERKSADRPAGVRTMSLVSLGSCSFTISSIAAFKSSTMGWDSSRVSAAIPSGVGFLGAGLIWKGTVNGKQEVRGLNTAATIWISAAAGVGVGGGLYFITTYTVVCVLILLRYGPQLYLETFEDTDSDSDSDSDSDGESSKDDNTITSSLGSAVIESDTHNEKQSLLSGGRSSTRTAKHSNARLSGVAAAVSNANAKAVDLSASNHSSSNKRHKACVAMYRD